MKQITITGSKNSGKTYLAFELAKRLAKAQKNVIILQTDIYTPASVYTKMEKIHSSSLEDILNKSSISQNDIKDILIATENDYISIIGFSASTLYSDFPKVTETMTSDTLLHMKYIADVLIIDGSSDLNEDRLMINSFGSSDKVIALITADNKGLSFHKIFDRVFKQKTSKTPIYYTVKNSPYCDDSEVESITASSNVIPYIEDIEKNILLEDLIKTSEIDNTSYETIIDEILENMVTTKEQKKKFFSLPKLNFKSKTKEVNETKETKETKENLKSMFKDKFKIRKQDDEYDYTDDVEGY